MKSKILSVCLLTVFLMFPVAQPSFAYTIDGHVDDWGINLSAAGSAGYLDTNTPSGTNVDYVTEDNADTSAEWTFVGPIYSWYNHFDAEALYFDNDQYYAYIAIITGLKEEGINPPGNEVDGIDYVFGPCDIFIDTASSGLGYEYGIDISTADLVNVSGVGDVVYYPETSVANPWEITSSTNNPSSVAFAYSDEQNTHYVLEVAIPLDYLGLSPGESITIHWTMECGNDYLDLTADVDDPVPAPAPEPATMLLFCVGLVGLAGLGRKKFSKKS